jgi:hypothetical protein
VLHSNVSCADTHKAWFKSVVVDCNALTVTDSMLNCSCTWAAVQVDWNGLQQCSLQRLACLLPSLEGHALYIRMR